MSVWQDHRRLVSIIAVVVVGGLAMTSCRSRSVRLTKTDAAGKQWTWVGRTEGFALAGGGSEPLSVAVTARSRRERLNLYLDVTDENGARYFALLKDGRAVPLRFRAVDADTGKLLATGRFSRG